jgi:hypothetical protein
MVLEDEVNSLHTLFGFGFKLSQLEVNVLEWHHSLRFIIARY